MSIQFVKEEKYLLASLEGKVDNKTAPEIQAEILRETANYSYIIIDMSQVIYMASAGLRVLLLLYRQIKAKSGVIYLVGVPEEIKDVMKTTGFVNFFKFSDSVEESKPKN